MIGSRIKLARDVRGITQAELAGAVGTTQSGIASMESGMYAPSSAYLNAISLKTGFDASFFLKGKLPEMPFGSLLYRSTKSVKKAARSRAHAIAHLGLDLAESLGGKLHRIRVNIPRINDDPESCAQITRSALGLSPSSPVKDLIGTLEKNGVLVILLPMQEKGFDGFSAWAGDGAHRRPVVALMGGKTSYRSRFSSGEELGHIVMHTPLQTSAREADLEARAFAGEFLLPAEAMESEMEEPVTLSSLAAMKPRWRVSIRALAKTAHRLGKLTQNQYRYLNQKMNATWGAYREPGDERIAQEKPRLMRKMAEITYGGAIDPARLSRDSGVPQGLLKQILCLDVPHPTGATVLQFKR